MTNARGVFSRPIAEYVVMMCLAIARRLPQLLELGRERTWQPLRGSELGGLTIGIVGFGSIGAEVARLLVPFGSPDRWPPAVTRSAGPATSRTSSCWALDRLARPPALSDIVVIAAPLTETPPV